VPPASKWDGPKHPSQMSRREHREWVEQQLGSIVCGVAMLRELVEAIDRRVAKLEGDRACRPPG